MGIFKKLFRKDEPAIYRSNLPAPNEWREPSRVEVILKVIQYKDADKNDQVRISMSGIGNMNVCLASFITKGVSYAQEKYNEYKQGGKDEEPETMVRKGGKR